MDQNSSERIRLGAKTSHLARRARFSRNLFLHIALLLAALAPLPVYGAAASIPSPLPRPGVNAELTLLTAANRERTARGIPQLRFDPVLAEAARFHALQMA